MQIIEIRLAGFKSFVDPTTVPIEAGLTGVIGPNGCGKSNLLEALRWAMGASSARAMRGDEMDDLIFAGTDSRPPRELAEVTLRLDNSRRSAPAAFNDADTLEITRKLRRGAGSSYRINGRSVRGRDIQLIFADASTGANSPALVRQGQISELIASKPQNRRRILEEAAGISGLHARRQETELRLRAAEANLEKLTEVSAEVERQLESLKRQARKARKYRDLSARLRALEAQLALLRWQDTSGLADQASHALEQCRLAVERTTLQAAVSEREALGAAEAIAPLRQAEQVAAGRVGEARINLARAEARRQAAQEQRASLQEQAHRMAQDQAAEMEQAEDARRTLADIAARLAKLPASDPDAEREVRARLAESLECASRALTQADNEAQDATARLAAARAEADAANATRGALNREREGIERDQGRLSTTLAALSDSVSHDHVVLEAEAELARRASALAQAETQLASAEAVASAGRTSMDACRQKQAEADRQVREAEAEAHGLERLLHRSAQGKSPPIMEALTITPGYEVALAAALGDDLNAPVSTTDAVRWDPANHFEGRRQSGLPDGAIALQTVVTGPAALASRLAQTGCVADADSGRRLASQLLPGQRLVSLEGHLWRWDGFSRTPDAPLPEAERLRQRARRETLDVELDRARRLRKAADAALADSHNEQEKVEAALKMARMQVSDAAQTLTTAREILLKAQAGRDSASVRRQSTEDALARLAARLAEIDERHAALPSSDVSVIAPLEAALSQARAQLAKARGDEMAARRALDDHQRHVEQAEGRRRAMNCDHEEWSRRVSRLQARLSELHSRKSGVEQALASLPDLTGAEAEIGELWRDVERLEMVRRRAADAVAQGETRLREADSLSRRSALEAAQSREAFAAASSALDHARGRLAEVDTAIRSQFGCTPKGIGALTSAFSEETGWPGDAAQAELAVLRLRAEREALGGVNPEAESEAVELEQRLSTQAAEKADLMAAIARLREGVEALNSEGRGRLLEAFESVRGHFSALFTALFQGGQAELKLIDADDPLAAGLEIYAQPPGKRLATLSLMSGGEQALTAAALIFAVFLSNPAPICVLDEVDAPLDDANVDRFCRLLDEMRQRTQTRFLVITHNPVTMSRMDRLFGVTMRERGVSKLVSVDLRTAEDLVAAQ